MPPWIHSARRLLRSRWASLSSIVTAPSIMDPVGFASLVVSSAVSGFVTIGVENGCETTESNSRCGTWTFPAMASPRVNTQFSSGTQLAWSCASITGSTKIGIAPVP